MDIRNSKEIIQDILERYNFTSIYSGCSNHLGIESSKNFVDEHDALDFLYSSAVIGSKALGIFNEVPFFHIDTPLRAECLLITFSLPKKICTPVVVIKRAEEVTSKLTLSLKLTLEYKIPVTVVITDNAINNYAEFDKTNSDMGRISPYIGKGTFKQHITQDELKEIYTNIHKSLSNTFNTEYNNEIFSLNYKHGYFPDYFIPSIVTENILSIKSKQLEVYESEKESLSNFFYENFNISLELNPIKDRVFPEVRDLLCPGCPFVNILNKGVSADTIIYTNIRCEGIKKAYSEQLNFVSIDGYIGIISSEIKVSTLFIGYASSYKPHYYKFLTKRGRMILLSDTGINKLSGFSFIKHPKKLGNSKNIIYPYSCNNIKTYSKIKIKLNKCQCIKENRPCDVVDKTLCPAIYKASNNMFIDSNMCNGCLACKTVCSKGAIS